MDFDERQQRIISCHRCERLVAWREQIAREKRKAYLGCDYWGKPVPDFGDPDASRLIVGLAPAAHGANRTGQMFTGDRSGDWLYRALWKAGVANLPTAESIEDGLQLKGVLISAAAHCAPPDNKPTNTELRNCSSYLGELLSSRSWASILCLGGVAWSSVIRLSKAPRAAFSHGAELWLDSGALLVASYHPSQQNTFTGRLTEEMLDDAIRKFLGPK